jgi:hypothetical protein
MPDSSPYGTFLADIEKEKKDKPTASNCSTVAQPQI